jgi:hypothetical protein
MKLTGLNYFPHRPLAAFWAIWRRRSGVSFLARETPPLRPSAAADSCLRLSEISPVAIRMTWTALPMTSAGRFSPLGPRGIKDGPERECDIYRNCPAARRERQRLASFDHEPPADILAYQVNRACPSLREAL